MTEAPKSIVVLGAASAMARAAALAFARDGYSVVLGAHDAEDNARLAADVRVRTGAACHALEFDALDFAGHAGFVAACAEALGEAPGGMLLCFGRMTDQKAAQTDTDAARKMIDVNLSGAISITERFAAVFEARKSGFIGIVSSVAGDRGKQSNYIYGASKAGLTCYAAGLRNRLFKSGVYVTTIQPGFVDTKMTYGLPLPGPLVASPEQAGAAIHRALVQRRHEVYVPFFWRYLMLIIKNIPEGIFKKMGM